MIGKSATLSGFFHAAFTENSANPAPWARLAAKPGNRGLRAVVRHRHNRGSKRAETLVALIKSAGLLVSCTLLAACSQDGFSRDRNSPFAPEVNRRAPMVDQLVVGHRLLASKEYELAIDAYNRAALDRGFDAEVLSALGTVNLALGRMGQAETLLRRAVKKEEAWPEVWNNLGVVLMETGKHAEAAQVFRKAYALDDGESDAIRDNLRLALAKMDNLSYGVDEQQEYKLVRRGSSDYLIRTAL